MGGTLDPWAAFERVEAPTAAAPPAVAPGDPWAAFEPVTDPSADASIAETLLRAPGRAARMVVQGVPQMLDMANNAGAAVLNAPFVAYDALAGNAPGASEPFRYGVIGNAARGVADAAGLPQYNPTPLGRIVGAAGEGVAGNAPLAAGAQALAGGARALLAPVAPGAETVGQTVTRALGTGLAADAVGGAAGGAAQQAVQDDGAGETAQLAANFGGGIVGSVVAQALFSAIARRRAAAPNITGTPPVDEAAAAWADPDVQAVARANGITDPADPRVAWLQPRLAEARAAEAERAAVPPSVTQADLRVGREAIEGGADPSTVAPPVRQPPPETIALPEGPGVPMRGTPDPNAPGIEAGVQGRARPEGFGALVPVEPQPNRMTPSEIARAQARNDGGNPNTAEPPPRFVAPENGAPRTPEQIQERNQARDAFDLADRQRQRAGADVRDTQPAPRPEGVNPETVYLDQGFPVRVLGRDENGFVSVERYDPRTGQPAEGAVPYATRETALESRQYAANPRQAQDFTARSESPRNPEVPREAGPGRPVQEPAQTYRATSPDPNADFPGATRPGPPEGEAPPGRSPLPDQPPPDAGARRWSSAEEAERAFQQRRAQAEADAAAARDRGEWNAGQRSTNQPGAQGADGRWPTGEGGYVASTTGGPIRFGDQKQAARWIIGEGQAKSPDQFFEIAVHPSGQGFTVREAGRNAGADTRGPSRGGAAPEGGAPPRSTPENASPARLAGSSASNPRPSRPGDAAAGDAPTASPQGGQPSARTAPPRPEPAARPAEAETTTRPPSETVETRARVEPESPAPKGDAEAPKPSDGAPPFYSTPLDPAAIKRFLLEPAGRALVSFRNALRNTTAARAFSTFFDSNRGALFIFRDMHPSVKEIGLLTDALASDPGSGRVVGGTFHQAHISRSQGTMNRVMAVLGKDISPEDARAVRDVLTGTSRRPEQGIAEKANRIRRILSDHLAYLREAGVEVGQQRNYFPRQYDETAIAAKPAEFQAAVAAEYRRNGMSALEADATAKAFFNEVTGQAVVGFRNEALLSANSLKGRTLPASADANLAQWMVTDPQLALSRYFARTSRVAEFTRRFGRNGETAAEWFAAMRGQGVPAEQVNQMRAHFQSATSTMDNGTSVGVAATAAGWIQTVGVVARLTGAVIASLPEAIAVGARMGSPAKGVNAMVDMFRSVQNSPDLLHARQQAEWLGIVGVSGPDLALAAQAGINGAQTKLQTRITDGLFRLNGLHYLTDKQRVIAAKYAGLFVRQMADEVAAGTSTTKASAARLLAELGIEGKDAAALSRWLASDPDQATLTGTSKEANLYRAAMVRFVDETIQNPSPVDKPMWAAHPIGRLAYGITSFQYSFARNVLLRTIKTANAGLSEGGFTLADRARLVGPMAGLSLLFAAQYAVSEGREAAFNTRQNAERDPAIKTVSNLDRLGVFFNLSPVVNMAVSARYQADPSSRVVGPYVSNFTNLLKDLLGGLPQPLGPNSPNTTNAENRLARTVYSSALAPAVVAAMALAAPAVPAPVRAAMGAAAVVGTRPDPARAFADAVAGPAAVRPRTPGQSLSRPRIQFQRGAQ